MSRPELDAQYEGLRKDVVQALAGATQLAVVQAPPGSGKTHMLLSVAADLVERGMAVALAAQTNRQADDIARRWGKDYASLEAWRLASAASHAPDDLPRNVIWETSASALPRVPGLYISTTAKWTTLREPEPFDLLSVDEAWQMPWADLMQCAVLSSKYFLIGDPGQIPPVVSADVRRWATSPRAPHRPAPEVVLSEPELMELAYVGSLPACRRLPAEAVPYVQPFYDFRFAAYARPGERALSTIVTHPLLDALMDPAPLVLTVPTSVEGPPVDVDSELAAVAAECVRLLLCSQVLIDSGQGTRPLEAVDIGVCATHRSMIGELRKTLGDALSQVSVDTPERWQGLERPVMLVMHPLSGADQPSDFDLETGRLCVMMSRQQVTLIVFTRDHLGTTLAELVPSATQGPGLPDVVGRGLRAHRRVWAMLQDAGRIFAWPFSATT